MTVSFDHALVLAGALFIMGIFCVVVRRNLIMMLLGLEIMLNAASIALVGAALKWHHVEGQAIALFIMAVAATEVSIGLAMIVGFYRRTDTVDPNALEEFK